MKKVLISWGELHSLCCEYKNDCRRYNATIAENNLELWFLGNKEIEDEKSID